MKLYIYPTFNPLRDTGGNFYLKFFHDSFKLYPQYNLVNRLWKIGISSIYFNLDADTFIIQWVDKIPFKRLGKIQFIFFLLGIKVLRLLKKNIVWVLHNKQAHLGKSKLVDIGMKYIAKMANDVITHSCEGTLFFKEKYPDIDYSKCRYIPHPVYTTQLYPSKELKWDYIIWGNIDRRKNILEFLKVMNCVNFFDSHTLLICGLSKEDSYTSQIKQNLSPNITFINKFLSDKELEEYIASSRCILFTYSTESVLSSGALIYSLNFCKPIIGPNVGSFKDMKDIVSCYNHYEDIAYLPIRSNISAIKRYIQENTWETFSRKIFNKK